jgi:hypothetical protein
MPPRSPCRAQHDRPRVLRAIGRRGRFPRSRRSRLHRRSTITTMWYSGVIQDTTTATHHQSTVVGNRLPPTGIRVPSVDRCERVRFVYHGVGRRVSRDQ